MSYILEIDFPTLLESGNKNIERVNPVLDNWKASVKSSPGLENALYESLKAPEKKKQGSLVLYIGGGVTLFGLLLMTVLFIRKKVANKD